MAHASVGKNQHVVPEHFTCGLRIRTVRRFVKRSQRFVDGFVYVFFTVSFCGCSLFAVHTVFGQAERRSFGAIHMPVL